MRKRNLWVGEVSTSDSIPQRFLPLWPLFQNGWIRPCELLAVYKLRMKKHLQGRQNLRFKTNVKVKARFEIGLKMKSIFQRSGPEQLLDRIIRHDNRFLRLLVSG